MSDTFQILATLAAAQAVVAMAPGPTTLLVARIAATDRRHGLTVAAGIWTVGLLWAALALLLLAVVLMVAPTLAGPLHLVCALHLAWLGIRTVRRSFADHGAAPPARRPPGRVGSFAHGVLAHVGSPKAIAFHLSLFTVTGVHDLGVVAQIAAVVMMPTVSLAWNALVAAVVGHRRRSRPVPTAS